MLVQDLAVLLAILTVTTKRSLSQTLTLEMTSKHSGWSLPTMVEHDIIAGVSALHQVLEPFTRFLMFRTVFAGRFHHYPARVTQIHDGGKEFTVRILQTNVSFYPAKHS